MRPPLSRGARLLLAYGSHQQEIADIAGVSQKHVSRVLAGEPEVSEEAREAVFEALAAVLGDSVAMEIEAVVRETERKR